MTQVKSWFPTHKALCVLAGPVIALYMTLLEANTHAKTFMLNEEG